MSKTDPDQDNSNLSGGKMTPATQNPVLILKKAHTFKDDLAAAQQQAKGKTEVPIPIPKPLSNVTGISRIPTPPVPGAQNTTPPRATRSLSDWEAWQDKEGISSEIANLNTFNPTINPSQNSFRESPEKLEKIPAQIEEKKPAIVVPIPIPTKIPLSLDPFNDKDAKQAPKKPIVSAIETFSGDVADNVKKEHTSLVKVAIAENDRKIKRAKPEHKVKESGLNSAGKNILIIGISLIFLALGIGAVYYFITLHPFSTQKIALVTQPKDIIQSEIQVTLSLDGLSHNQFIPAVQSLIASANLQVGQVEHVNMVYGSTTAVTQDLFALLQTDAPPELIRSFNDPFYFGIDNASGSNEPFLILTTDSYSDTEGGMLEWESTMLADLQDIFLKTQDRVTSNIEYSFQDALIDNKEVRLIKNTQGQIIFLYSLINQNTLIIATNQFTFEKLLNRLNNADFVR